MAEDNGEIVLFVSKTRTVRNMDTYPGVSLHEKEHGQSVYIHIDVV